MQDKESREGLMKVLIGLVEELGKFVNCCNRIWYILVNMPVDKYGEITGRAGVWAKFTVMSTIV